MARDDDRAPIVYDADGNPMRVRVVGHECEGEVSGEGHYGYRPTTRGDEPPTVWFEGVSGGGE